MLGSFWELRKHPNVQMLWYEDMVMDMTGTINTLSSFLGYSLTKEQLELVEQFVEFDKYKENCQLGNKTQWNEGEGHFIRKGKVGDWKNYMQGDMAEEWDVWAGEELYKLKIKEKNVLKIFI